jgi:hypothetical protein
MIIVTFSNISYYIHANIHMILTYYLWLKHGNDVQHEYSQEIFLLQRMCVVLDVAAVMFDS